MIGALIVAPKIGIATSFAFVVLGQLIGAAVIDRIGGFGVVVTSVTWVRATGILLVCLGAAVSQWRF